MTKRDLYHTWNKLSFNSDQNTVQEFTQELDLLAANGQIIDKFKEYFPPRIESQLLDINDLDHLVTKANQLVQLFKPKTNNTSSLLSHSEQQQIAQNTLPTNEIHKEYKVHIGSKWNNNSQQKNRVQYQNLHSQKGFSQPNNQTQTHTQFQQSNRGNCSSNQGNNNDFYTTNTMYTLQRGCSTNYRMNRGTFNNVNDCQHLYRGNYQYRYPQYRNHFNRQFQGSRYRKGSNRSQQTLQNDYNYEANVRPWHFNDYMRQNEEYDENIEYKGQWYIHINGIHTYH